MCCRIEPAVTGPPCRFYLARVVGLMTQLNCESRVPSAQRPAGWQRATLTALVTAHSRHATTARPARATGAVLDIKYGRASPQLLPERDISENLMRLEFRRQQQRRRTGMKCRVGDEATALRPPRGHD